MTFRTQKFITREMLRAAPETLFAFGDNMVERGYGGQAKQMRGEPNAVGIPTKWAPSNAENSFFCNSDYAAACDLIGARFSRLADHLAAGGDVVWPEDGIGTGLAQLQQRAPRIWDLIDTLRAFLEARP